jgi:hypothetical protein
MLQSIVSCLSFRNDSSIKPVLHVLYYSYYPGISHPLNQVLLTWVLILSGVIGISNVTSSYCTLILWIWWVIIIIIHDSVFLSTSGFVCPEEKTEFFCGPHGSPFNALELSSSLFVLVLCLQNSKTNSKVLSLF